MLTLPLAPAGSPPRSVLCLGAHCDDIEIGCGGTLLEMARDPDTTFAWVVFSSDAARAAELGRSFAAFTGGHERHRLFVKTHRDGFLPYDGAAVKEEFEQLKRQVSPDIVFTHYRGDRHQDHRLLADITWQTFRDHLILEYEIPKYDGDLGTPNTYVPLPEDVSRTKVRYLLDHYASQRQKPWFTEDLFLSLLRLRGMECRSPSGLAEGFHCRKVRLSP